MSEIKWQEPPPPRSEPGSKWRKLLEEVMTRPGKWALIASGLTSNNAYLVAHRLRNGAYGLGGQWEATTRVFEGTAHLYVRYLGPAQKKKKARTK